MLWLIERWISAAAWFRAVLFVAITLLVTLLTWLFFVQPHRSYIQQLEISIHQASQQVARLKLKVRQIPAPQPTVLQPSPPAFSVTEFVRESDGERVKWLPDDKQGVLEMLVPWQKLPRLFARLGAYRVVGGHAFTITADNELLKLALTMEFADEP